MRNTDEKTIRSRKKTKTYPSLEVVEVSDSSANERPRSPPSAALGRPPSRPSSPATKDNSSATQEERVRRDLYMSSDDRNESDHDSDYFVFVTEDENLGSAPKSQVGSYSARSRGTKLRRI